MADLKFNPIPELTEAEIQRFWRHVRKRGPDDCWRWTGAHVGGMGKVKIRQTDYAVHRIAFRIQHGDPGEAIVFHRCKTGDCANGSHLVAGSHVQMQALLKEQGRVGWVTKPKNIARGENHGMAKLCKQQVLQIRRRLARGSKPKDLAAEHQIGLSQIYAIRNGTKWAGIKP